MPPRKKKAKRKAVKGPLAKFRSHYVAERKKLNLSIRNNKKRLTAINRDLKKLSGRK